MSRARPRPFTTPALAGLLALAAAAPASAADLGRLFLSPQDRATLDRLRASGPAETIVESEDAPAEPVEAAETPPPQAPRITVNGIVRRSDGRGVAWVNGMSTLDGDFAAQHFNVAGASRGERVRIETPGEAPQIDLKPGQSFEPGSQRIVDVRDPPPPPPPP